MANADQSGRDGKRSTVGSGIGDKATPVVRLEQISASNRKAVLALELDKSQEDLVADNASSLKEAKNDDDASPRAVVADDRVVGFLMYDASEREALIYRFMIDRREQGRGFGRAAINALIDEIRGLTHVRDVLVCYMPENEGARKLYLSIGFVEEGVNDDGETMARLSLDRHKRRP